MERTQIPIHEMPPAGCEREYRFRPQLRARNIHEHQVAVRYEQFVNMPQRRTQIAHRMQYVGADDKIERARLKTLVAGWLIEIQNFIFHSRKASQFLHGGIEKSRGNVGESVGVQLGVESCKHVGSQSSRAGPNLQDSESPAFREMTCSFLQGCSDRCQPMACVKAFAVKLVQKIY